MTLERLPLFNSNRPVSVFMHWEKEGYLVLNPPYQRGDVWGPIRRVNLIRSLLLHIPIPSIIINDRSRKRGSDDFGYAVIDGKQRITTILMFMRDEFAVPGDWFGIEESEVSFLDLPRIHQLRFENGPISLSEGALESLEDEKMVFELVNFGGVPQGQSD